MTILESLREPITVQGLVCLAVGTFLGVASCVVPVVVFGTLGPKVECKVAEPAR